MCRERHRVKNLVGEVQYWAGAEWGGAGCGLGGIMLQMLLLAPEIQCLSVSNQNYGAA